MKTRVCLKYFVNLCSFLYEVNFEKYTNDMAKKPVKRIAVEIVSK